MAKIVIVIEDVEGGTSVSIDKSQSDLDNINGEAVPITMAVMDAVKAAQLVFSDTEPAKTEKFDGKIIQFPTNGRKDH